MKKTIAIIILSMITILPNVSFGQTTVDEKKSIENVIKTYVSVTDKKDSTAILKAFHPDAKLMSVSSAGPLYSLSVWDWWNRIKKIEKPVERKYKITILNITGLAAMVTVEFATSVDCISLLKFNNEWKIVNKTLSVSL